VIEFVITGTGRSGTMWAAQALTAAGLPCAHEFTCSSWMDDYSDDQIWRTSPPGLLGESSWQAAPFVEEMQAAGVRVVHLVRHPMEVASSLVANEMLLPVHGGPLPWHRFIEAHIGDHIFRLHPHDRALRFWTEWNMQIKQPDLRWDQPVTWAEFADLGHLLGRDVDYHQIDSVPTDTNRWSPVKQLQRRDFTQAVYDEAMDLWGSYF
jgi:hypothetical protein